MAYELGPLVIRAEGWPSAWIAWADGWLRRVERDESAAHVMTVEFAAGALPADEQREATSLVDLLRETRCGPAEWEIRSAGSFIARLDESERRLRIMSSPRQDPQLALGNALRTLTATTIARECDGLMIHAAAGVLETQGVLVAGVSTAGKTTLAMGFRDTTYVSDDVALVVDAGGEPTLVPSPFYGAAGIGGAHVRAPLRAIGILVAKETAPDALSSFEKVSRSRGAAELLRHVARFSDDRQLSSELFDVATRLVERVPVVLIRRSLRNHSDDVVRGLLREAQC